ncbi:Tox-REase-5 domain-containing protein [Corallococcus sp. RDP092CA]|uniref:Tox-REase-5 domain-containing protein n=1 Tax=Corallococcus sp. RDP092CA TaxID=3109369 RepID=UPI0035B15FC7
MRASTWLLLSVALLSTGCVGGVGPARRGSFQQRAGALPSYSSPADGRGSARAAPSAEEDDDEDERTHRRRPTRVPAGTALITTSQGERTRLVVQMGLLEVDAFEKLLVLAGLDDLDELPLRHNPFTQDDAVEVLGRLMQKPVTLGSFPPRMAAGFLLREVLEGGEVSREELLRRVKRFSREQVAVLRPDGYLAWALDGRTQQKVAPVEWKDGAFRAHGFELGRFYSGKGGVFRVVDARLQASDWRPLAEVYDDGDVVNRSLDGAEDAFVELYYTLGQLLSRPVDSIAALGNLPAGLAALISSSPAYWERFQFMTQGEQIREVARLATSVFATWGTASTTTRTLKGLAVGAEATVPVLSLSAEGVLALERVAVPAGRAASVLSGGPGAAIILQRANAASKGGAPAQGPGQWGPANESMSARARRYQEQITGHSADEAYWVGGVGPNSGGVKFDGFKDGVLLEAKGPGYAKFFEGLEPKEWFRHSGDQGLIDQAQRQLSRVRSTGTPIQWHVAEMRAADAIRLLLNEAKIRGIEVVHTPAL